MFAHFAKPFFTAFSAGASASFFEGKVEKMRSMKSECRQSLYYYRMQAILILLYRLAVRIILTGPVVECCAGFPPA